VAATASRHRLDHRPREDQRRGEIHLHGELKLRLVELLQRLAHLDAGVRDQDVDVACRVDQLAHAVEAGDVGRHPARGRAELPGQARELLLAPSARDELRTACRELARDRLAEPPARARQQHPGPLQPHPRRVTELQGRSAGPVGNQVFGRDREGRPFRKTMPYDGALPGMRGEAFDAHLKYT
jgi:hypothetical protein